MKRMIPCFLLLILASGCGCGNTPIKSDLKQPYEGVYAFGDTLNRESPNGKAFVYAENDSTLLFYIYVNNGAPSYNSGSVDGRIAVSNGKGVFRKRFDFADADCVLDFDFRADTLTVKEVGNDCQCGFGHGVYLDDTFFRTSAESPSYYTTIANDTVYFSRWHEEDVSSEDTRFPKITKRVIDYFPDMVLGRGAQRGAEMPSEIVREFCPDLLCSEEFEERLKESFYAVGKITGYKGMDLFVCDYDSERLGEESYDNSVDNLRWLLFFDDNGQPLLEEQADEISRNFIVLNSHYYGEGGENSMETYFDTDTTLVTALHYSESESATGYATPLVFDEQYRWAIGPSGEKEIREITRLEFSSPFYDHNWLNRQGWDQVTDDNNNRTFPTVRSPWNLSEPTIGGGWLNLSFCVERIDGQLVPVFEVVGGEGNIVDRYLVGQAREEPLSVTESYAVPKELKCPVIIKTSDGDLEYLPEQRRLNLRK